MTLRLRRLSLAAVIAVSLASCGSDSADTNVLAYIPSDTPYVFANEKPTPRAVAEAWMAIYGPDTASLYADLANNPVYRDIEGDLGVWIRAWMAEMGNFASVNGYESMGFKIDGRLAIYGHGLLPVYRVELSDEAKLRGMVDRVEKRAGKTLATRKIGDATLWQFNSEHGEVLFGVVGPFFVATVTPPNATDDALKAQLGMTKPATSLADSDALGKLNKQYGYDGYFSGYVDLLGITRRLTKPGPAEQLLVKEWDLENGLAPNCVSELESTIGKMPRVVMGTTEYTAKQIGMSALLELESGLGAELKELPAPIPGADLKDEVQFRMAFALNIPKSISVFNKLADQVIASPYTCEDLVSFNQSAQEMKESMSNPGLAMAGSVTAVHAALTQLTLDAESEAPTAIGGYLAVASPSPLMLWGFAQQGLPPFSQTALSPDGKIVALPDLGDMPVKVALKALMHPNSLSIATSDVEDSRLEQAAKVPASTDGTVLRYGLSGLFFKMLAEQMPTSFEGLSEEEAKEAEQGRKLILAMGNSIDEMDVRLKLTERGVEMTQTMSLK